ncbi:MAG: hypothetical protein IPJ65_03160 [Archangiaceae bacterium]|nr:hypothetical protein [Archangiaceae bacterium]
MTCATTTCNGTTVCVDSQCVQPSGTCGGFAGLTCPSGQTCVDNPRDNCDPAHGGADCGGVCITAPTHNTPDAGPMHCGGFVANPQTCPTGYQCVDDPSTCSMALDCPGICVVDNTPPTGNTVKVCGGYTAGPPPTCASGEICVNTPWGPGMEADAQGVCIQRIQCGGFAGLPCPGDLDCADDPTDNCDPAHGGADCIGRCVLHKGASQCGGIAGLPCPGTLRCLDIPNDSCDPNNGGADCGGICVP